MPTHFHNWQVVMALLCSLALSCLLTTMRDCLSTMFDRRTMNECRRRWKAAVSTETINASGIMPKIEGIVGAGWHNAGRCGVYFIKFEGYEFCPATAYRNPWFATLHMPSYVQTFWERFPATATLVADRYDRRQEQELAGKLTRIAVVVSATPRRWSVAAARRRLAPARARRAACTTRAALPSGSAR
jgi:hypothetical protein